MTDVYRQCCLGCFCTNILFAKLFKKVQSGAIMVWCDCDDVIKWKHFPCYWPFVREIHQSPVDCPHKGQWCRALMFLWSVPEQAHYSDVIMGDIASQITSLKIVYSTLYSDTDQRKHQSSASLAFVWGIHRRTVNSAHKWPVTRKIFPFDDVIMSLLNNRDTGDLRHHHTQYDITVMITQYSTQNYRNWGRAWIKICTLKDTHSLPMRISYMVSLVKALEK